MLYQKRKRATSPSHVFKRRRAASAVCPSKGLDAFESAVEAALSIFREAYISFTLEQDIGEADEDTKTDRAAAKREAEMVDEYEDTKAALLNLLPWLPTMKRNGKCGDYHVIEFQGYKPPDHLADGVTELKMDKLLAPRLNALRMKDGFRALEALCGVMATISARKERHWLEVFGNFDDLKSKLKRTPGCRSKGSARRKEVIRAFIENECRNVQGYGYFGNYLVNPMASFRVTFAPSKSGPVPAAIVLTKRMPLFECLSDYRGDNGDACLRGEAKTWEWCNAAGTQFAFQEANLDEEECATNIKCRMAVAGLKPDPKLRALLLSRKPVLYLDAVASLAPREVAKKEGHSEIVKAELARLTREAHRRGEAVVMVMGSDKPHLFAKKVYMRKPIADYGLRCGYVRWRASADHAWAAEKPYADRPCLCVQMPGAPLGRTFNA
jgi:hypothetical protein